MTEETVHKALKDALAELYERDHYLFGHDVNERSITHRLAIYIEAHFRGFHVDCEYNRSGDDTKRLIVIPELACSPSDLEAKTVYPDIIVHRRGANEDNLLVVEVKKTDFVGGPEYDRRKLQAFLRPEYNYRYAAFVLLDKHKPIVEWLDPTAGTLTSARDRREYGVG